MELNLSGRYVAALNLLLIGGIAYFAAQSVNDIIVSRMAAREQVSALPAPAAPPAEQTYPRSRYDLIVSRDIFNPPHETAPAAAAPEDLHLRLLGTSIQTKEKPYAALEDERSNRQSLYRLGDDIPDAGKLVEVEKNRIVIDRQGKRVAIEVVSNDLPLPAPAPVPAVPPVPGVRPARANSLGVRRTGAGRFMVDRSTVDSNLQNLSQLFTQMRAIPNIEDGKTNGFRLSEIQQGSMFEQIGLRDGDIVTGIGGQELNDPAQALTLLNAMRQRQSIEVSILRGGRPMQLEYDIR
jgi:general secretion pathway protein C